MDANPYGRPRTLDDKKQRELVDLVHHGSTVEEAAKVVGVSLRTVQRQAKADESFDHDLQLALQSTNVDCEKLVLQAARTHWRAAAWVLERRNPDHYAKRPPNSCSPETLLDVMAWVIEKALEATPPEHREAVFRHTQAAADKAFEQIMPGFRDSSRRHMVEDFGARPTPLSDQEIRKTWLDPRDDGRPTESDEQRRPLHPAADPDAAAGAEGPGGLLSPKMSARDKSPDDKSPATDSATTQIAETAMALNEIRAEALSPDETGPAMGFHSGGSPAASFAVPGAHGGPRTLDSQQGAVQHDRGDGELPHEPRDVDERSGEGRQRSRGIDAQPLEHRRQFRAAECTPHDDAEERQPWSEYEAERAPAAA